MNRLPLPDVNDEAAFFALANNPRVGSYPHLQVALPLIVQAYIDYMAAQGNANTIVGPHLSPQVTNFLKTHYENPPKDISFITMLRQTSEVNVCSLCGSMHSGTLDHLLPKKQFPAFSVYSRNLVPACKCNGNKGLAVTGATPEERVLHPYFDDCLSERLIGAKFEEHGEVPKVTLAILVQAAHQKHATINFHVESIVKKTGIETYLRKCWVKLCRQPSVVIPRLDFIPANLAELEEQLLSERSRLDQFHESKNNWNSVFFTGLLEPLTLGWLFSRLTIGGRLPTDAIV